MQSYDDVMNMLGVAAEVTCNMFNKVVDHTPTGFSVQSKSVVTKIEVAVV